MTRRVVEKICTKKVCVAFWPLMLSSKTLLLKNYCQRALVEQLVGGNVVFDAVLPIVLHDFEHLAVVELCKLHSLDVMSCCGQCRC